MPAPDAEFAAFIESIEMIQNLLLGVVAVLVGLALAAIGLYIITQLLASWRHELRGQRAAPRDPAPQADAWRTGGERYVASLPPDDDEPFP